METPKLSNRKTTKLKFFAVYAFSMLLVFVVLSSFLKIGTAGGESRATHDLPANADARFEVDQLLHRQMEKLTAASSLFVLKAGSQEAAATLKKESNNFSLVIDSLRKATASLDDREKERIQPVLDAFSRQAERQVELVKTAATVGGGTKTSGTGPASDELNELKGILVQKEQKILELETKNQTALQEKDRTITDLRNRLDEQPAVVAQPRQEDKSGEWKDKYEKLRAAHDKLKETNDRTVSEANSLKVAYKEVVDDNRRLITQLQSARATKN